MHLTKHHGLGNDFLVALVDSVPSEGAELARAWCERRRGVGADGLIFATPATGNAHADLAMTLFNADGSPAEVSGNGLRCLAQAHALARDQDRAELRIVAGARTYSVTVLARGSARQETAVASGLRPDGPTGVSGWASVDMGPVEAGPPLPSGFSPPGHLGVRRVATGTVGNPHVVLAVDDLGTVDLGSDGPVVESSFGAPGINVHFLVGSGSDRIRLLHWERGAGITAACGSGATVAAARAHEWGLVGDRVVVQMPGGEAEVTLGATAVLAGPTTWVASIEVPCA